MWTSAVLDSITAVISALTLREGLSVSVKLDLSESASTVLVSTPQFSIMNPHSWLALEPTPRSQISCDPLIASQILMSVQRVFTNATKMQSVLTLREAIGAPVRQDLLETATAVRLVRQNTKSSIPCVLCPLPLLSTPGSQLVTYTFKISVCNVCSIWTLHAFIFRRCIASINLTCSRYHGYQNYTL